MDQSPKCRAVRPASSCTFASAPAASNVGTVTAPVLAQMLQEPRREGDVAVLVALCSCSTRRHTHPSGVDIRDLQSTEFAGTKPRGVGGHQHGSVLEVVGDGEQAHRLVVIEDLGQRRGPWRRAHRSGGQAPTSNDRHSRPSLAEPEHVLAATGRSTDSTSDSPRRHRLIRHSTPADRGPISGWR